MTAVASQDTVVEAIGPLTIPYPLAARIKGALYRRVFGLTYDREREALSCLEFSRRISARLVDGNFDIVLSPGSVPVSRLNCSLPIVIWTDATFASYINHYDLSKGMCDESIRSGHATEMLAFGNASLLIFASDWAANSAISDYGANPSKVRVVPFGANFETLPNRRQVIENIHLRSTKRCELLTIGVDWNRKGVPRAIALAGLLNERGLPTTLTVVGCLPPAGVSVPEFVKLAGFIDKRSVEGERRLSALFAASNFHVLFSTAEAFGVVFAEANAHGVPNISSDVGGIGAAVINGRGGQRFRLDGSLDEVADYVMARLRDRGAYLEQAMLAREEYETRLNWQASGAIVRRECKNLLGQ